MLLANSSVSGKAATGHVLMYAPTGGFPRILAIHPKSLRQIGKLGVGERTPEVLTNLSCGRFVFCWEWEGIEALAEPIFVRGCAPSMAGAPRVRTSFVGGSFFIGGMGGDRSIGEANLRKGLCPFNGRRTLRLPCALFYESGALLRVEIFLLYFSLRGVFLRTRFHYG